MAAGRNNGAAAACSGLATNSKLKAVSPLAERAAGASTWHRAPEISRPGVPGNAATKFSELLLWRAGLDTKPPLDFPALPSQRGEAHPCPFRGRHGCACWGTGGSGWIPQGRNPGGHRPRFHREVVQGNAISFHELTSKSAIGVHGSASRMERG